MVINIEHEKAKMAPVSFGDDKVGPVPSSLPVPSLLAQPSSNPGSSSNLASVPNTFPGAPMVSVKTKTSQVRTKVTVPYLFLFAHSETKNVSCEKIFLVKILAVILKMLC
jgi:hypothetical protein